MAGRRGPGTPLSPGANQGDFGGDVKWTPGASHAIDATLEPDFSQIEADVPQIGANERFALFYPEKRPFFLEGRDLFSTPFQVVYTRTVTSPQWGVRATGRFGAVSYTALVARDEGGGSVILPSPTGSTEAEQDFRSYALIGRARRDFGRSFLSLLATAREIDGGGFNRVAGPDFQWRPSASQIGAARLYSNRVLGKELHMVELMKRGRTALLANETADAIVTESAAAETQIATGVRAERDRLT